MNYQHQMSKNFWAVMFIIIVAIVGLLIYIVYTNWGSDGVASENMMQVAPSLDEKNKRNLYEMKVGEIASGTETLKVNY